MASLEYAEFRAQVIKDASKMDRISPCQKGMGFCCTPGVPVSHDEFQDIVFAASSGKIREHVLKRAVENNNDPNHNQCPFLGKSKNCMIYEYRPLECISFGRGALFVTEQGGRDLAAILNGEREDGLTEPGVAMRACEHCQERVDPNTIYPAQLLVSSQAVALYYQMQPEVTNLNEVATFLGETLVNK